jgi:hypothetical protein
LFNELCEKGLELEDLKQQGEQIRKENEKYYTELENQRKKLEKEQSLALKRRQQQEAKERALEKKAREERIHNAGLTEIEKFIEKVEERRKELRKIIQYKKDPKGFMEKYKNKQIAKLM